MSDPRLLLLETSGHRGFVALAQGERLLGERPLLESRRHARDMVPFTSELLAEQKWMPRDLTGVIVSIGPGSYTGLRVGLMAAKSLAYATGCLLIGIETFAVIATQVPFADAPVDVLADAQQQRVYWQPYRGQAIAPLKVVGFDEWLAGRDPAAFVSGPGVAVFADRLAELRLIEEARRVPTAEGLLKLGLRRFLAGERDSVWELEPVYLRPSSAEEQWQRKVGGASDPAM